MIFSAQINKGAMALDATTSSATIILQVRLIFIYIKIYLDIVDFFLIKKFKKCRNLSDDLVVLLNPKTI
jgi:hypothetical protein